MSINSVKAAWYNESWTKRVKITVQSSKVDSDLSNFPVYVKLADLPAGFFANVKTDGGDIRVTKSDGTTEVARELVAIDTSNATGEMHFVASGTLSSSTDTDFYIYYGNAAASEPAEGAAYGKHNTWVESFAAVWHLNDSVSSVSTVYDSTSYSNDGTTQGTMTSGDSVTGKMGQAFDLDGTDDFVNMGDGNSGSLDSGSGSKTLSAWVNTDVDSANQAVVTRMYTANNQPGYMLIRNSSDKMQFQTTNTGSSEVYASTSTVDTTSSWKYMSFVYTWNSGASAIGYTNGAVEAGSWTLGDGDGTSHTDQGLSTYGHLEHSIPQWFNGKIDEVRIANTVRSAAWVKAEYENQNSPNTFYTMGSEEAVVLFDENNWSDYISVTIDSSQLNGDLTNYPVFIDLSHFNGTNFFAVVQSDGADVRVTQTDNATLLAREVVVIDTENGTGELHFLANGTLSSSSDTTFHIFYGNPSASEPAANNQFGSENVWINNFAAVWHMSDTITGSVASIFDSTANHNHATPQIGSGTMTLAPGRVGLGTYMDNNAFLLIPASASMHPTHVSGTVFSKPDRLYRDANMNNSSNVVFMKGTGTAYDGFGFGLMPFGGTTTGGYTTDGRLSYVAIVGKGWDDGKYDVLFSSIASQPATAWNIAQSAYSDTTGQFNLFQFGLLDNGETTTGDISATNASAAIGQSPTWRDNDEYFRGIIDEVRYSSTDRSINWTSTEYTNLTCPYLIYSVDGLRPDGYYTLTRGALFPADDATGVSTTGLTLTITYNKEVYPFTGNFYLKKSSDDSTVETIPANHATKISGYATNTLSIALSSTLDYSTGYYVSFDSNAIVDFCGQVATPISNNTTWDFTTVTAPVPTLSTLSPVDNATGVAIASNLVITFSEAVDVETGNITIKKTSDDSTVETINVTGGLVTGTGTSTITINPSSNLTENTEYYVLIDATAFDNVLGNSFAVISSTTTWSFTTVDNTAPTLSTLSPADNATGVSPNANLVITFDEAVNVQTGNVTIKTTAGDTVVETIDVTGGQVTGDGTTTITINPTSILANTTEYYVLVDATAFDDLAGNSYAGISSTTAWSFTTGTPGAVASIKTYPVDNQTNILLMTYLELEFSSAMSLGSGNVYIYKYSNDSLIDTIDINSVRVYGDGTDTIRIYPLNGLIFNESYYVLIDSSILFDVSANAYAGISAKTQLNFSTKEQQLTPLFDDCCR